MSPTTSVSNLFNRQSATSIIVASSVTGAVASSSSIGASHLVRPPVLKASPTPPTHPRHQ